MKLNIFLLITTLLLFSHICLVLRPLKPLALNRPPDERYCSTCSYSSPCWNPASHLPPSYTLDILLPQHPPTCQESFFLPKSLLGTCCFSVWKTLPLDFLRLAPFHHSLLNPNDTSKEKNNWVNLPKTLSLLPPDPKLSHYCDASFSSKQDPRLQVPHLLISFTVRVSPPPKVSLTGKGICLFCSPLNPQHFIHSTQQMNNRKKDVQTIAKSILNS